jgi:hypothetical protein
MSLGQLNKGSSYDWKIWNQRLLSFAESDENSNSLEKKRDGVWDFGEVHLARPLARNDSVEFTRKSWTPELDFLGIGFGGAGFLETYLKSYFLTNLWADAAVVEVMGAEIPDPDFGDHDDP